MNWFHLHLSFSPKNKKELIAIVVFFLAFFSSAQAQKADSLPTKLFRPNNIKFNLSSNILYHPALLFSYERVVTPHQSFSAEAGFVQFPKIFGGVLPGFNFFDESKKGGFKIGGDYRFYLARENKHQPPHGLYIGPFIAYYHFFSDRNLSVTDTSIATGVLALHTTFDFLQAGAQMGYQFSFLHDRMTLDFVLIGPALSYYSAVLNLDGDINPDEENETLQQLLDFMADNFPLFNDLTGDHTVKSNGRADVFGPGFRYAIYAGFRF